MRRVLVVGNMGYIGPVLVRHLRENREDLRIEGADTGYFAHCLTGSPELPERLLDVQRFVDIRAIEDRLFQGVDAVVLLAAISNDPIGNRFEAVTHAINVEASLRLARAAKARGVSRLVFASSCSVYGAGSSVPCNEESPVVPLTAYARSKVGLENELKELADASFWVTCLRFGTACGFSDRLRLDLVLNDFVACALTTGKIVVLSDGTPWRPLIHVKDMSRAMEWGLVRKDGGNFLSINAGSSRGNYQVVELASATANVISGAEVSINTAAQPDKRTYRVDFGRYETLAEGYTPQVSLHEAIEDLVRGLGRMKFADANFRQSNLIRLHMLNDHIRSGRLTERLEWAGT
jgi:nucleoside-diphosphate-sugar epimerase